MRALGLVLLSLVPLFAAQPLKARERLQWLVRDLPPFTIQEGERKGQGVIDQLLPRLIEQMPEYDHSIVRVNRARGMQMLQERQFTCDPTLLWTPERARFVQYSKPTLGVLSSGVVVRKRDQALLAPYLDGQQLDLRRLLEETQLKLGIVAERSYSVQVDDMLRQLPERSLSRHYGNEATGNLLQMQQLGRVQLVLGYWPEIRYLAQQQGGKPEDYQFLPIKGTNRYQLFYIACADSTLGREAIARIDRLLAQLRKELLPGLYADWLDPEQRTDYLKDTQRFFEEQPSPANPTP
ncbi:MULTISPECIES: TIGR02285 family protein [unclassified Pseudomonas]|uniref:TIGR02285 family protein n=1 Tax=unclassified Pseudomonas TaxID=196821 RepID=UPI0035C0198D